METIQDIQNKDGYDPQSMRVFIRPEILKSMPFKEIDNKDFESVMCKASFNPIVYYPRNVVLKQNEVGYDSNFRYVVN